jgi:hypothetical protein
VRSSLGLAGFRPFPLCPLRVPRPGRGDHSGGSSSTAWVSCCTLVARSPGHRPERDVRPSEVRPARRGDRGGCICAWARTYRCSPPPRCWPSRSHADGGRHRGGQRNGPRRSALVEKSNKSLFGLAGCRCPTHAGLTGRPPHLGTSAHCSVARCREATGLASASPTHRVRLP